MGAFRRARQIVFDVRRPGEEQVLSLKVERAQPTFAEGELGRGGRSVADDGKSEGEDDEEPQGTAGGNGEKGRGHSRGRNVGPLFRH